MSQIARSGKRTEHPEVQADAVSWRTALLSVAAGLVAYGVSLALGELPAVAEGYARTVSPFLTRPLSRLTGAFPFALGEVLLGGYGAFLLYRALRALARHRRGGQRLRSLWSGGLRRILRDLGLIATAFYLVWGFNYARAPFETRAGWPSFEGAGPDELVSLAEQALVAANAAYLTLHGSPDAGRPTAFPEGERQIEEALQDGWVRAAERLDLHPHTAQRYGSGKRPLASWVLARFGIAGVYTPWTAEANTLRGYPPVRAVHSLAHEQAHQRGFAIEAEANFIGFVVGASASHPLPRYSAAVYAGGRFLSALRRIDPEAARQVEDERYPGIDRDLEEVREFWARYQWAGTGLGAAVNDRYLRANRVPGGVRSYALADRLLIEFARQSDGRLFPDD